MTDLNRHRHVKHNLGRKGELSKDHAEGVARMVAAVLQAMPNAKHELCIDGFDDDPRPVWEIPEARQFFEHVGMALFQQLQTPIDQWGLEGGTEGMLAMCLGIGRIVASDGQVCMIEFGVPLNS